MSNYEQVNRGVYNATSKARKLPSEININEITNGKVSYDKGGFVEERDLIKNFLGAQVDEFVTNLIGDFSFYSGKDDFAELTDFAEFATA